MQINSLYWFPRFSMTFFQSIVILLIITQSESAFAQWTTAGADLAGRFQRWKADVGADYGPEMSVGASSLAFTPDGTLYLACEKYPTVLAFADSDKPHPLSLTDHLDQALEVDIEGMSAFDGKLYLADEDKLCVYRTTLQAPGRVEVLPIEYEGVQPINKDSLKSDNDDSNFRSLEGIVVSQRDYRNGELTAKGQTGPWVYLLDELDEVNGVTDSKLYIGKLLENRIVISEPPISFSMTGDYRLPELFEHEGKLCALRTSYAERKYFVVELDLKNQGDRVLVNFTPALSLPKVSSCNSNYEGAAVHPKDGRLFLTADNERLKHAVGNTPTPSPASHPKTPILVLPKEY